MPAAHGSRVIAERAGRDLAGQDGAAAAAGRLGLAAVEAIAGVPREGAGTEVAAVADRLLDRVDAIGRGVERDGQSTAAEVHVRGDARARGGGAHIGALVGICISDTRPRLYQASFLAGSGQAQARAHDVEAGVAGAELQRVARLDGIACRAGHGDELDAQARAGDPALLGRARARSRAIRRSAVSAWSLSWARAAGEVGRGGRGDEHGHHAKDDRCEGDDHHRLDQREARLPGAHLSRSHWAHSESATPAG